MHQHSLVCAFVIYHTTNWVNVKFLQKDIVGEDIFTASTQTAVVLAELAVDTDETTTQSPTDLDATGFLPVEEVLTLQVREYSTSHI